MQFGISIYVGLDNTLDENLNLIHLAHQHHIQRIFTSLHIPETNLNSFKQDLAQILALARKYNMEVISDISPNTLTILGMDKLNIEELRSLGITTLRLDFGYSAQEIADLSNNNIKLQFNASTITAEFLEELKAYHTNFKQIDALHNFYPREGTGLNIEKFIAQNKLLHEYNISIGAFVPSYNKPRSPFKRGLPSLECHRYLPASVAMQHLKLLGIDSIFIGDSLPTKEELTAFSYLNEDYTLLNIKPLTHNQDILTILNKNYFTVRIDDADTAIRTQESRMLFKNVHISPEYITSRKIGDITLDNIFYARYMGELEIITTTLLQDNKINTIAKLLPHDLILLPYLKANTKFKFKF